MSTRIGSLMGCDVFVESQLPAGVIEFRNGSHVIMRFSVDHPYIQGTEIERTARAALAAEKT